MTTEYPISGAREADALVIASLFALSWTSPFTRLQFGNIDPPSLAAAMAPRVAEQMKKENCRFLVVRHPETYELAAVAHWTISHDDDDATTEETPEEIEERQLFDDEAFRNKLPESSNRALIMEFTVGLRGLRERTLAGKKHFMLENIATHPDHRGRGLASRLIEWAFPQADERGLLVYLDTASDNPAKRLYEKLGFEEVGRQTIEDLSRYGGEGTETHVALIRSPRGGT